MKGDYIEATGVYVFKIKQQGTGKTTLAKNLSTLWNCHHVESVTTVEEAIQNKTALGEEVRKMAYTYTCSNRYK